MADKEEGEEGSEKWAEEGAVGVVMEAAEEKAEEMEI